MAEILSKTPAPDLPDPASGALPDPSRIGAFALIVGGMKCGSTSLFEYLATHPQVARGRLKEPNFFNTPRGGTQPELYAGLWPDFDPARHRIALEASVNYTKLPRHPGVTEAISAYRGRFGARFRFLYILRNPIDRIESHIAHSIARGRCSPDDYTATMRHALAVSRYAMQIRPYRRIAGRGGLLLLDFDRLNSDPLGLLNRCTRFLGLDQGFAFEVRPPSNQRSPVNDSASFRLSALERAWIGAALAEDMETLAETYRFDVSTWGFGTPPPPPRRRRPSRLRRGSP